MHCHRVLPRYLPACRSVCGRFLLCKLQVNNWASCFITNTSSSAHLTPSPLHIHHLHTLTFTHTHYHTPTQYPDVWKRCPQNLGLWHKSDHRWQEYQDDLCGDSRMDGTGGHTPWALLWEGGCLVLWCVAMGTAHPGEALPCKAVNCWSEIIGEPYLDTCTRHMC